MNKFIRKATALIMVLGLVASSGCSQALTSDESVETTIDETTAVETTVDDKTEASVSVVDISEGWVCPTCGTAGNIGRFCAYCGSPIPASLELPTEVIPSEDISDDSASEPTTHETYEEAGEQGSLYFNFGTIDPFPVNDPETGLELYVRGNGVCYYDLGDTEYSVEYIKSVLLNIWGIHVADAVESNNYSQLLSVNIDISEDVASDLEGRLGLRNVMVSIIGYALTEQSQAEYDAALAES